MHTLYSAKTLSLGILMATHFCNIFHNVMIPRMRCTQMNCATMQGSNVMQDWQLQTQSKKENMKYEHSVIV